MIGWSCSMNRYEYAEGKITFRDFSRQVDIKTWEKVIDMEALIIIGRYLYKNGYKDIYLLNDYMVDSNRHALGGLSTVGFLFLKPNRKYGKWIGVSHYNARPYFMKHPEYRAAEVFIEKELKS